MLTTIYICDSSLVFQRSELIREVGGFILLVLTPTSFFRINTC